MQIAICDDCKQFSNAFVSLLAKHTKSGDNLYRFSSGVQLLESCRSEYPYDLTFLDMEMPGLLGLEVAREIRKCYSRAASVVFLTEYPDYAVSASEHRPMRYLLKPVSSDTLSQILDDARSEASLPRELLLWQKKHKQAVALRDILYIDVFLKTLTFHTCKCEYTALGSLADYCNTLEACGFFRIGRSLMVNLEQVEAVDNRKNSVCLRNGEVLPVSRKKIVELTNTFCGRFIESNIIGF